MRSMSWRTNLMVLFTLILGTSLLFQLFYTIPYVKNQNLQMTKSNQEDIAHSIVRELDIDLLRAKDRLTRIAKLAEFVNMDIAKQHSTMTKHVEILRLITCLFVMDARGWFVSGSIDDLSPYTSKGYAERSYFIVPFEEGQVYFSTPSFYPGEGIVGTSVSVPIELDTGERVGVLMGGVSLNDNIEIVSNYPLDEGWVTFVVDNEGTVVAHSEVDLFALEEGPLALGFSDRPLVKAVMEGEMSRSEEFDYNGTSYFGTYALLESNGWGVLVEAPMDVILAASNALARQLLLVNIALFAVALPVSLFLTREITFAQKRAERNLQKSEERYRSIADTIPDGLTILENGKVVYINDRACEILGYSREELIKLPGLELAAPEERGRLQQIKEEFERTGIRLTELEFWIVRKDGTRRYIRSRNAIIREDVDGSTSRLVVNTDITERKQMEDELRRHSEHLEELVEERTKKLQEAQRMATIGETTTMVGHDLRNPLQAIVNNIYLAKKKAASLHIPEEDLKVKQGLQKSLKTVGERVEYMNKIVLDLQDYSRPVKPKPIETDMGNLIDDLISMIDVPGTVKVSIKIDEGLPKLMVDPDLMRRVLTNLFTNALQAMPQGGKLTIVLCRQDQDAIISVQDTGVGIPEENLGKLFQPLFTTKAQGQGFGLPVCKRLVEAHGGSIDVESEVGKGTTFTVRIPLGNE